MNRTLLALAIASVGLVAACSSLTIVSDTPMPTIQPSLTPTVLVLNGPTPAGQVEPAPDPYRDPRATVTAWFDEHESPYKRIYLHHIQSAIWKPEFAPSVYMSGWDEATGRFTYGVLTGRTKIAIEERATSIGVPLSMLSIEVRPQIGPYNPEANTRSESGIELEFDLPELTSIGTQIMFQATIKNSSNQSIEIENSELGDIDVVVLAMDGEQLWRHQQPVRVWPRGPLILNAGEASDFSGEWGLMDDFGASMQPGPYLVRGFASFYEVGSNQYEVINLATAAIPFTLSPAP